MKTEIVKILRVSKLRPGQYRGLWGGYVVVFGDWRLATKDGVRGFNIPCVVSVAEDGSATVVTIDS